MTLDDAKALKILLLFIDEIAPYVKRTLTVDMVKNT